MSLLGAFGQNEKPTRHSMASVGAAGGTWIGPGLGCVAGRLGGLTASPRAAAQGTISSVTAMPFADVHMLIPVLVVNYATRVNKTRDKPEKPTNAKPKRTLRNTKNVDV